VDREIPPATLALMRGIKEAFDPRGLLNPGKGLPTAS
jgi:D-lactate dehydrogenase